MDMGSGDSRVEVELGFLRDLRGLPEIEVDTHGFLVEG